MYIASLKEHRIIKYLGNITKIIKKLIIISVIFLILYQPLSFIAYLATGNKINDIVNHDVNKKSLELTQSLTQCLQTGSSDCFFEVKGPAMSDWFSNSQYFKATFKELPIDSKIIGYEQSKTDIDDHSILTIKSFIYGGNAALQLTATYYFDGPTEILQNLQITPSTLLIYKIPISSWPLCNIIILILVVLIPMITFYALFRLYKTSYVRRKWLWFIVILLSIPVIIWQPYIDGSYFRAITPVKNTIDGWDFQFFFSFMVWSQPDDFTPMSITFGLPWGVICFFIILLKRKRSRH